MKEGINIGQKTAGVPYSDYQQLPLILHLNNLSMKWKVCAQ